MNRYSSVQSFGVNYQKGSANVTEKTDMNYYAITDEKAKKLSEEMPADEKLYDLAELFKVFGDSTRIRILYALLESEELCVSDLAQFLTLTPTACSHQLRVLKNNKLLRARRDGKTIFYSLADEHVRHILGMGMEHIME